MRLTRFNKLSVLKGIGPVLLSRFLARFQEDFNQFGLPLPPPDLEENDYYNAVAHLLNHPDKLPDRFNEALFALEAVSGPDGCGALESLPRWRELSETFSVDSTCEEIALQLWLLDAELLAHTSNTVRLKRLTAFEHVGRSPRFQSSSSSNSPGSVTPVLRHSVAKALETGPAALDSLRAALDKWFVLNDRGEETTRVEVYFMGGEYWFLIRHGDRYSRTPAINSRKTEIIHFRPERDDVVVYSPELNELRINARTKGERDLYIRQFGLHLHGSEDYFERLSTYTLEPLRTDGADALDTRGFDAIENIKLHELETWSREGAHKIITSADMGLFEHAAAQPGSPSPVPKEGRLQRAIFHVMFKGAARARPIEIKLPNTLKVGRRCDGRIILTFLSNSGFRRSDGGGKEGGDKGRC